MELIATNEEPGAIGKILRYLELPTRAPPRTRPESRQRALPLDEVAHRADAFDGLDPSAVSE